MSATLRRGSAVLAAVLLAALSLLVTTDAHAAGPVKPGFFTGAFETAATGAGFMAGCWAITGCFAAIPQNSRMSSC